MAAEWPRGIVIQKPWIDKILDGAKTWELRKDICHLRGPLLLAEGSRFHGCVNLQDCVLLEQDMLDRNGDKHCVGADVLANANFKYAWILSEPLRFEVPVDYRHPQGAQKFFKVQRLAADVLQELARRLPHLRLEPAVPSAAPRPPPSSHGCSSIASDAVLDHDLPAAQAPSYKASSSKQDPVCGGLPASSGNTSPSMQAPRMQSHSAEALCDALRSQGLCLTHTEKAGLLAALAKCSFRATPRVITTLRTHCPRCGSLLQQSEVVSRRCPKVRALILQEPDCVSATHVPRWCGSCRDSGALYWCGFLQRPLDGQSSRSRVMEVDDGFFHPDVWFANKSFAVSVTWLRRWRYRLYFHRASFQGEAMLLRATDANLTVKVRTLRQLGFIRRSFQYNLLRLLVCLLGPL